MKKTVIVIVGPTASGKSGLGIELAKKTNGVVISADSMQIYKGLDVGTAKVTEGEAQGIKHELIDIVDINQKFSVSEYKEMCYAKIEEVLASGKTPIIVGGTGLYINAIVNNMSFEKVDEQQERQIEDKVQELIQGKTSDELYDLLKSLDEKAAERIEKGNDKRVIRAIKLCLLGTKKSDIDERNDLWQKNECKYNFLVVYIDMPRDLLYDRINKRVDQMLDMGVLDEVKFLYNMQDKSITACQAIGYKEFFEYIEGTKTLEKCIELLKQKTRNYAKRQITWFKKLQDKFIVDGTKTKEELIESILREYNEKSKC
ncbi:MAG: tRNA (adenosine(37)-N6)-dimethylallyltransferase MiaA [Clostridia bacterium]|nr:tRNA (adenosine(37)-N6)-dimethylallyltransferase MiaA [Clostridia bacterium]